MRGCQLLGRKAAFKGGYHRWRLLILSKVELSPRFSQFDLALCQLAEDAGHLSQDRLQWTTTSRRRRFAP